MRLHGLEATMSGSNTLPKMVACVLIIVVGYLAYTEIYCCRRRRNGVAVVERSSTLYFIAEALADIAFIF